MYNILNFKEHVELISYFKVYYNILSNNRFVISYNRVFFI